MSDAVIAASVAAIVAMVGYVANNIIAYKNTGRQLQHDREQKHAERRLTLRREIYLGVAAHLQDSLFAVSDFALVHVPMATTQANWRKNANFAAQLHLMAGPDMLRAYNDANALVGSAIGEVAMQRSKLEDTKTRLTRYLDLIRGHDEAKARAMETMRHRGREGTLDDATHLRLNTIVEGEHKAREALAQEHDTLLDQQRAAQRELLRFAQEQQLLMYPLFVRVAQAARGELGEPFDGSVYEEILRITADRARAAMERAFGSAASAQDATR